MIENRLIGYELKPVYKNDLPAQDVCSGRVCCITRVSIYGRGCNGFGNMIHPEVYEYLINNRDIKDLIKTEIFHKK
jgi:hypothetical protein